MRNEKKNLKNVSMAANNIQYSGIR